MSSTQKVIKYLAVAFAIFLIATIFLAITSLGLGIIKGIGLISNNTKSNIDHSKYSSYLDINVKYSNLKIVKSNILKVENNNEKINVDIKDNNKLYITDKSNIFTKDKNSLLTVYVPDDFKFDIVNIAAGAGKMDIDGFVTNDLFLDFGAGDATIKNIKADKSKINAGTGSVNIKESVLNDAKFNLGIGDLDISANITGDSKFNCGIGEIKLNLLNSLDDYSFDISKGVGTITLNHNSIGDGKIGNGNNSIIINGGIGEVSINTK